jgi:hypothetical protein
VKLIETNTNVRDALHNKTMMALPAFESSMKVDEDDVSSLAVVPRDKKDVLRQLFNRTEPFHLQKFRPGHGPTDFGKWFANETGATYGIAFELCFEPYVLTKRDGLPWFWTGFRGFGMNKMSWFEDVHVMDYKFAVLRDYFVFHIGQSSSPQLTPLWVRYEYRAFKSFLEAKVKDLLPKDQKVSGCRPKTDR